ncbi:hypothetical protein PGTUg99_005225 [Puccinia graminis f. sp. tritici]|uniref:Uncharacterized protein n=1 Tax=Puccinia graminis f. sp. tritici TaxID=56615 RepID=A0A5B0RA76_PUCGR|nr:hypothetical protein PGTUg99_005225 [Puccinia graminis f. sp. tritici]
MVLHFILCTPAYALLNSGLHNCSEFSTSVKRREKFPRKYKIKARRSSGLSLLLIIFTFIRYSIVDNIQFSLLERISRFNLKADKLGSSGKLSSRLLGERGDRNLSRASSDVGRQHRNSQMNLKSNKPGCSNRSRDSKSDAMEFGILKSLD